MIKNRILNALLLIISNPLFYLVNRYFFGINYVIIILGINCIIEWILFIYWGIVDGIYNVLKFNSIILCKTN